MRLCELIENMAFVAVPDLQIGQLVFHNFLPNGGIVQRIKNSTVIVKAKHDGNLYRFNISSLQPSTLPPRVYRS